MPFIAAYSAPNRGKPPNIKGFHGTQREKINEIMWVNALGAIYSGRNLDFSKQHSALFCKVEMSKHKRGVCGVRGGCIFLTAAETDK